MSIKKYELYRQEFENGLSISEIAEKYNKSYHTIHSLLDYEAMVKSQKLMLGIKDNYSELINLLNKGNKQVRVGFRKSFGFWYRNGMDISGYRCDLYILDHYVDQVIESIDKGYLSEEAKAVLVLRSLLIRMES